MGTLNLGNAGHGIYVGDVENYYRTNGDCASFNTIGDAIAGNIVSNNGGDGIAINYFSIGNMARNNSIKSNAGLGINLANDNTLWAGHYGNENQPAPVVADAVYYFVTGNLYVTGTVNGAPDTPYAVELFTNTECDTSGAGEGESAFASAVLVTDATGDAAFDLTFPGLDKSLYITATATDPDGNTSEFSPCVTPEHITPPHICRGDVAPLGDPDGLLNLGDYVVELQMVLGLIPFPSYWENGDLYPAGGDGEINLSDLLLMRSFILNGEECP